MSKAPKKNPCGSCPYRKDVPSGVWDSNEYLKLIEYDRPTHQQPIALFQCHQQDEHLCSGWVGTHDMAESLSLRIAGSAGWIAPEDMEATLAYESPVPLFETGMDAAVHGMLSIPNPGEKAQKIINKMLAKRGRSAQ